jgi:hypothetical protein
MVKFCLTIKILIVLSLLFWLSCSLFDKENTTTTNQYDVTNALNELPQNDTVMLGAKMQNPYSVDTIRQAIKRLVDLGTLDKEVEISPTHYYVRFLPRNSSDIDAIHFNSDLILMAYPIDREILTSDGIHYRGQDLSDGQPNSKYSVVPVGLSLPNVPYEILAELYLEGNYIQSSP